VRASLLEAVLVAAIGAALAFAANGLSPWGLKLGKDYFPGKRSASTGTNTVAQSTNAASAKTNSPAELLAAKLRDNGLQLADSNLVSQLYQDPRRAQDWVVFIDARDDEHYEAGHIPGAYHFYYFYPEKYITNVMQVCLTAERIVFYCNGGDCEDSEHAAITLRDSMQLPKEKLFVYVGGMTEWATNGLSIEVGARNSGVMTNVTGNAASGTAGGAGK
jgi:rhodanese-related sulfurtransferase